MVCPTVVIRVWLLSRKDARVVPENWYEDMYNTFVIAYVLAFAWPVPPIAEIEQAS